MTTKAYRHGCFVSLLIFGGILFAICVVEPTVVGIHERIALGEVIGHAKSVELVHYGPGIGVPEDRVIYSTKTIGSADIRNFLNAIPWSPDLGFWGAQLGCIFDPHHKLIVTDDQGNQTAIRICFECDHIRIGKGPIIPTPYAWRGRLRAFFANEGMANKSAQEYLHDGVEKFAPAGP
jgi:hypothetical protein